MGTHTPGPWAVRGNSIIPEAHKAKSLGGSIYPNVDAERFAWPIANFSVNGGLPRWTAGQKAANARLIAAAPDSHDANVKFVEAIESLCNITPAWSDDRIYDELPSSGLARAYFMARAAIAKTTGGQP